MAADAQTVAAQLDAMAGRRTDRRALRPRRPRQRAAASPTSTSTSGTKACSGGSSCSPPRPARCTTASARPDRSSSRATRNGGAHGYDERRRPQRHGRRRERLHQGPGPGAPRRHGEGRSTSRPTPAPATWPARSSTRRSATPASSRSAGAARSVSPSAWRSARLGRPIPARALGPDSVVVVTGAAGSIVSAIVADLARAAGGGTFHLLDLIPEPDPADPDLAHVRRPTATGSSASSPTASPQRGERATPVLIERELAAIERRCAAQAAIDAITAAGGTAHWYSRRPARRRGDGRGGGGDPRRQPSGSTCCSTPEAWRSAACCPTSRPAEFDLVFDVKADGWFHLLHGLGDVPIGTALVFSSIAGRFGNGGQTDYSAANDLLCKSVSSFRIDTARRRVASPSTGRRGPASAWPAAARSRR